jgi:hypothetical protein
VLAGVGEVLDLVSTEVPAALVLDSGDPVTFGELTGSGSRQCSNLPASPLLHQ